MEEKKCQVCNGHAWVKVTGLPRIKGACCFACNKDGKKPRPAEDVSQETVGMSPIR